MSEYSVTKILWKTELWLTVQRLSGRFFPAPLLALRDLD